MSRVFDASLAHRLVLPSQASDIAERLIAEDQDRWAPDILQQEVLNGIHRAERRQVVTRVEADQAARKLASLSIQLLPVAPFLDRAWKMAREHRQPNIFDAIYLVCAEELGAEMWTCDRKFVASFAGARPAVLRLCPDDVP